MCAVLSHLSRVRLFATLWTVACQASLPMGSPGKNTGVVAMPSSRDLPDLGIEPISPALQMNSLLLSFWGSPNLTMGRCHSEIDSSYVV